MGGSRMTANGVDTYYERTGSGEALLFLHGAFGSSGSHAEHIGRLAEQFDVIATDRRAHGRTPDVAGPISYEVMAEDAIAFLDTIGVESAHVVGYSDGANVGLIMASQRPARVRKLVAISGNTTLEGLAEDARAFFLDAPASAAPAEMIEAYTALSPDGKEHFPEMYEKMVAMFRGMPPITREMLGRIQSPTLVMCADDDVILLDHTVAIYRALSNAQLCIVPGASHLMPFEKPDLMLSIVTAFLLETASTKIPMF